MSKRILRSLTVLVCLALAAACKPTPTPPVAVQVTLTEMQLAPSITSFKVGQPYAFTIVNNGTQVHELRISPPMSAGISAMNDFAGVASVQPGASTSFTYTFTQAYAVGGLEFACHLPGHYEGGMHTLITVQ